ncbi:MAG: nuclear transport factor 2 family protein [Flavitalea sp.]
MQQPTTQHTDVSEHSRNLVTHHLESFKINDLNALMSDYTEQSVFITQQKTYVGLSEIRSFFVGLIAHFPPIGTSFTLDHMEVKEELAFIVWHGQTPSLHVPFGSDTFIINEGKIKQQTFVGELNFIK